MAGDWMKMELDLPDKPEVHHIAGMLNIDPDAVVGKLFKVWIWFNRHTTDGNAASVTLALVDRYAGVQGFGEAMCFAGWLLEKGSNLVIPNFDRHISKSAKSRAMTASRQDQHRNATVTQIVTQQPLPREEKRIVNTSAFAEFWKAYPKKKNKGDALKAWKKVDGDSLIEKILPAIEAQRKTANWQKEGGQFIPYPASWLNAMAWEDEDAQAEGKDWV